MLKDLRVRNNCGEKFIIISIDQVHSIGVTECQILDYLIDNGSIQIKATSGSLFC